MGKILTITSGKGGCGVSSAGLVFAAAAGAAGKRVLLVDGDTGYRTPVYLAAAEELLLYDLADAAAGRCVLQEAWYASPAYEGVWVLPAPLQEEDLPLPERAVQLVQKCAMYFDEVIVDLPARSLWLAPLTAITDELVVCSGPDPLSVRACGLLREKLTAFSGEARLIISKFYAAEMLATCGTTNLDDVIDGVGLRLLGVVPLDDAFARYTMARDSRSKKTAAWRALCRCLARLHGENIPLQEKDLL